MREPPPAPFHATLRDRTPVLIRPVAPEDKPLLREAFTRLSDASRYQRFMRTIRELSEEELDYLTRIDYTTHMAWVALDPSNRTHPGLGVARYVRLPHEPTVAEVAITVVDSHQGRGLGTMLLGVITRSAVDNGIETFVAHVLGGNVAMLNLLTALGVAVTTDPDGLIAVRTPLPRRMEDLSKSPAGRVFREVARQLAR